MLEVLCINAWDDMVELARSEQTMIRFKATEYKNGIPGFR